MITKGMGGCLMGAIGFGDGGEGQILRGGTVLLPPQLEEAAVAERDVLGRSDGQSCGDAVDPLRRAFELGELADGGFIDHAVTLAVRPLGAPLLVAKGGVEAEGMEDQGEVVAVGDFGFCFNAVFVRIFAGTNVRQALVGEDAAAGIVADAENLGAGAHFPVGGVIKDVALKAARGLHGEAGGREAVGQRGQVVDAEFDFGFDGHGELQFLVLSSELLVLRRKP